MPAPLGYARDSHRWWLLQRPRKGKGRNGIGRAGIHPRRKAPASGQYRLRWFTRASGLWVVPNGRKNAQAWFGCAHHKRVPVPPKGKGAHLKMAATQISPTKGKEPAGCRRYKGKEQGKEPARCRRYKGKEQGKEPAGCRRPSAPLGTATVGGCYKGQEKGKGRARHAVPLRRKGQKQIPRCARDDDVRKVKTSRQDAGATKAKTVRHFHESLVTSH